MNRRRFHAAMLVTATLASTLFAQSPPPGEQDRQEVPELAGAAPGEGSQLVDGALPRPFVDYSLETIDRTKRFSLFYSGFVVVTTDFHGARSQKRIVIPPDAVDTYRKFFTRKRLATTPATMSTKPTTTRETIRIYDPDGRYEERTLDPSVAVAADFGMLRGLIQDLIRVVEEDQELTNPMLDYVPRLGDILVGRDLSTWSIVHVYDSAEIAEVVNTQAPVTMYVPFKEFETRFVGHRPAREHE